jgi:hypothetical protein
MRVALIMTRNFPTEEIKNEVKKQLQKIGATEIHTGGGGSAQKLGIELACELGLVYAEHSAQWARYGKAAGPIRANDLIKNVDAAISAWDGYSRGTAYEMKLTRKMGKPLYSLKEKVEKPKNEGQANLF